MTEIVISSGHPDFPLGTITLDREADGLVVTATDEDGTAVSLELNTAELAALLAAGSTELAAMLA